jgi:hypothetical protein
MPPVRVLLQLWSGIANVACPGLFSDLTCDNSALPCFFWGMG